MARRKSHFRFRLPLLKSNFKINRRTFFTIIGLLILLVGVICLLSFMQSGSFLIAINTKIVEGFGAVSFLLPVLIILFATHFFNSKKLQIIKLNITGGLLFIFIALLGFLHSGKYGALIFDNLRADISLIGAFLFLFITLLVGVIIFFNTSLDDVLLITATVLKKTGTILNEKAITPIIGLFQNKDFSKESVKISQNDYLSDNNNPAVTHATPLNTSNATSDSEDNISNSGASDFSISSISTLKYDRWVYPPLSVLSEVHHGTADFGDVNKNSAIIERTLDSFGIHGNITEVNKGPTVTQYGLHIALGTKLSKITALSTNLALDLAAPTGQIRIEAPIPGRSLVGIEIPNPRAQIVALAKLLGSPEMVHNPKPTIVPLGLDVSGQPQIVDIASMPHMLIAGTTGSGKSVILNAWIASMLFRTTPHQLRLILVDPKRVEFVQYNGIPHLLTEVIVEPKKIISALKWTVSEMENRYKLFATNGVRNIETYNQLKGIEKIPYIIFMIDELAELMMFAAGETEELITRIAQLARATGIHLIIATQRPSVNVITGVMKANIPARISFNVATLIDSRVVLDTPGAEKLLGKGDMLFLSPDKPKPKRIQGPFLTEGDITKLVAFIRAQVPRVDYTEEITNQESSTSHSQHGFGTPSSEDGLDPLFNDCLGAIHEANNASASFLQRKFKIGYSRAARILDQLQEHGYVGPQQGSKAREILRGQS